MKYEFLTRANAGALNALCTGDRPEFASANSKRQQWLDQMLAEGLRGWIAFKDRVPVGYIEYLPIEATPFPVAGKGANFVTCLWVLPAYEHQGIGGSLLAACLGDSRHGVATVVKDGERRPVQFFKHLGFGEIDRIPGVTLLGSGPVQAKLQPMCYLAHERSDRLAIDVLYNPECPWSTRTAERVVALTRDHPARGEIDLWVADAWSRGAHTGLFGGIYMNGVQPFAHPPTDDEITRAIDQALAARVPSDL